MTKHLKLVAISLFGLVSSTASLASTTTSYVYDPVGQLVTKSTTGGSAVTYSYDNAGNRSQTTASPVAVVYYNNSLYAQGRVAGVWQPANTTNIVATPIGGKSSYTYLWQYVSGDTAITSSGNTVSSINWTRSGGNQLNGDYTAVWRCKVTDANGTVTYGPNVTVDISFDSGD
jgi:YD repeat-containing protein